MSEFDQIVKRAFLLRKQAEEAKAEADALLDSLGDLDYRDYPAGQYVLKVTPTKRFDPATAEQNLTPKQFALTLATKPDSETAKRNLAPVDYAKAQKTFDGATRKIVEVTDV